jgi:deoxycytidylate deaminase
MSTSDYLDNVFNDSEIIIGLVGAAGTDFATVSRLLETRLQIFGYKVQNVRISTNVLKDMLEVDEGENHYDRVMRFMDAGDFARLHSDDSGILALGAAGYINKLRNEQQAKAGGVGCAPKTAWIINSLKNPAEVAYLKQIYTTGFCLIGVYADESIRKHYLDGRGVTEDQAKAIFERDYSEEIEHGQSTRDTFHLSDYFCQLSHDSSALSNNLARFLDLTFGQPTTTPTFDEYAMYMAFASSLRSADLSRQVGAVITTGRDIIATGANDCPRFGGGQYWPEYNASQHKVVDRADGRDYMIGHDANNREKEEIIKSVLDKLSPDIDVIKVEAALRKSRIADLTEFGRMVHAEMDALLVCARNNISLHDGTLYCTTFPCHNCAKHIVSAGLKRVVFVEPYSKSPRGTIEQDCPGLM